MTTTAAPVPRRLTLTELARAARARTERVAPAQFQSSI